MNIYLIYIIINMNYIEQNIVYEKTTDNESYHGGYSIDQNMITNNSSNNMYLGGNPKNISMFEDKIVPFGLFYNENKTSKTNHNDSDTNYIDGGLIDDNMFDKLLLSVGKIEKQKNAGKVKTRKNHTIS